MKIESSEAVKRLPQQFFATLVDKVSRLSKEGYDIINLGQGNPDQETPPAIIKKLQEAAMNPQFHRYSPFTGYTFFKEAIVNFYKREYQVELDPDKEVAILFGGKAGLVEISQILLNPNDLALVPDPGYPDYWSGIAMADGKMHLMPLLLENNFLPQYDEISPKILNQAKLMFLNYPNNPTGAIATKEFFQETVKIANKFNIPVIHDFAYAAIGYDHSKPISFLQTPSAKEVGIEIYTLSKTFNMAGWRVAFAVGNEEIIRLINLWQDHLYVSLFGAIQSAASYALNSVQDEVENLVKLYERRRNTFFQALNKIGWKATPPKGTFFAWLPVPNGFSSSKFADILIEEAHVVVAPGIGFGQHGDKFVRIALLTEEDRLLEAVERIGKLHLFA